MRLRVAITGSSGCLGQQLMARLGSDPACEFILGLDIRRQVLELPCAAEFLRFDMTAPWELLAEFWTRRGINAALHLAWQSDPLHDARRHRDVDVQGSLNFFRAAAAAGLKRVVYCGSTTAYLNSSNSTEPPWLAEDTKTTGMMNYLYSAHQAEVDRVAQDFMERHPAVQTTILRGAMVLGPHARNIVSKMIDWPWRSFPWMFQVKDANPPLQFLSEEDMCEILFRAVMSGRSGVFNCAGEGVLRYSEVVRASGKRLLALPAGVLYPLINLLWKSRLSPFPSGILDTIRYTCVADTTRLKTAFGYSPRHTSRRALESFLAARNQPRR